MGALVPNYTLFTETALANVCLSLLLCVLATGNVKVCAEVGNDRQSTAEGPEGTVGCGCLNTSTAGALHSPRKHGMRKKKVELTEIFRKKKSA